MIDLDALDHNYREVVRCSEGQQILAVVKARAYGHGAVEVSKRLLRLGADMLGVALVEEGRELRDAGIHAPILVMGATFPEQAEEMVSLKLTPVVFSLAVARALSEAAHRRRTTINVHVKIDTGMGRIGVAPEEAPEFIAALLRPGSVSVQGLMTHFADADLRDKEFASRQMDRFESLLNALEAKKIHVPMRHAANSAAVLDFHRAFFTVARPGLMLYGYNPLEEGAVGAGPAAGAVARHAYRVYQEGPAGSADQLRPHVYDETGKHHRDPADRICRWVLPRTLEQGRRAGARHARPGGRPGVHGHVHDRCHRRPQCVRGRRRRVDRQSGQ
jgi:alanine racemase